MKEEAFSVSKWPRVKQYFGIAHGWPGFVWVSFQLDAAGLLPLRQRIITALQGRLRHPSPAFFKKSCCSSHLIGSGSYAVIAALAAAKQQVSPKLFRNLLALWFRDCERSTESDVMLGSAGALLASAEIETVIPAQLPIRFLKRLRDDVVLHLRRSLEHLNDGAPVYLGFSHGIAGCLFALEMCDALFELKLQSSLREACFDAITANRLRTGKNAMVWPESSGEETIFYHSWCHGAPGIALALLYSYKLTGFDAYREIAEEALEGAFRFQNDATSFCCGATGRAQILIEAFRATKNRKWFAKAKQVATKIQFPVGRRNYNRGFHAGRLGYDYLLWRLKYPTSLALPGLGIFSSARFL